MSNIFGIGLLNGHKVESMGQLRLALDILFQLSPRKPATEKSTSGVAIVTTNKIKFVRKKVTPDRFIIDESYKTLGDSVFKEKGRILSIIGHTNSTSYHDPACEGKELHEEPLTDNWVIGANAGIVSNAISASNLSLFRTLSYKENECRRNAIASMEESYSELSGSINCVYTNIYDKYSLHFFRGWDETIINVYEKIGLLLFASESNIKKGIAASNMNEVADSLDAGDPTILQYPDQHALIVDLLNNTYTTKNLTTGVIK